MPVNRADRGLARMTPLVLVLALFLSGPSLFAQDSPGRWGDDLTVRLALIGPGDELHFWWGHIGLVVEDRGTGQALFYDWGVFSFDSENFFRDFAMGRLFFRTEVSPASLNYHIYVLTNRDIILFTLDLPAEKKEAIVLFAENNVLPENSVYEYHHFWDNCSTRIRDVIDMALGGQFKARYGEAPGRFTLRQHVRRHTWFNPFFDWILNFWMGQGIDRPITVWDEMFLPSELAERVYGFRYIDPDGNERPLVSSVQVVFSATDRPAVLDVPRLQWPRQLLFSLLLSGALVLLYLLYGKRKWFTVLFGGFQSMAGLFFGIAGSMLFFLTFFTNHDYTFYNINVLFVNPVFLAAVPLGLTLAFTKNERRRSASVRFLRLLWAYVFAGCLVTVVIRIFPAFYQQNHPTQALILPLALAVVFITTRLGQRAAKTRHG
ncbi:MAG: DUF4105 domain-containing protein [Treponema sp.]|nr:DUF4105 domain-containing protein [Treponema sp.]